MADSKISALGAVAPSALTVNDFTPISRGVGGAGGNAKVDLSLLVPPRFAFSDAGAVGAKTLTISPANPGGASHANYVIDIAAAVGGVDEAINVGYNYGAGKSASEPSSTLNQEIDYVTTARGVATQRTMEAYLQFSASTASGTTNAERGIFFSFEPGDTSRGGTDTGQLLYGYISTGYNRNDAYGAYGGGGFTILQDGVSNTGVIAVFDKDGAKVTNLRASTPIILIATPSPSAAPNAVLTVPVGHGINVNAIVQVYKPFNGGWAAKWNGGSAPGVWENGSIVTGRVTATTSTTLTTNIDNSTIGIVGGAAGTGYGVHIATPTSGSGAVPVFQFLAVGTSTVGSVPFTFEVAGNSAFTGTLALAHTSRTAITSGDVVGGILNLLGTSAASGGLRQYISISSGGATDWSIGYPDDTSGNNFDDYMLAFGGRQSTASNFTTARQTLLLFSTGGASPEQSVGIDGIIPYRIARLCISAGNANYASINLAPLASASAKGTPVEGDIYWNSTTHKLMVCEVGGAWKTVTTS
jgi:hypothetical protein